MRARLALSTGVAMAGGISPAIAFQCVKPAMIEHNLGQSETSAKGVVLCPVGGTYSSYPSFENCNYYRRVASCFDYVQHSCGHNSDMRVSSFTLKQPVKEVAGDVELYAFECTVPGKDIQ